MAHPSRLTARLSAAPAAVLALYALGAAFGAYFCMYAFRKPFTAARFEGHLLGPWQFKTVIVISQIVGYTLSKYVGIGLCSSTRRSQRVPRLLMVVAAAEAALLLFAVAPTWLKPAALFLNGLCLGVVWGLVVSYLEGRRTSDLLLAGVSCSFVVSGGVVKDVGLYLESLLGVGEFWMPAVTGLVFLPAFVGFVWLLDKVPEPDAADVAARVLRRPMNAAQRRWFFRRFLGGMVLLVAVYFLLTAFRDFRDTYGIEILDQLGYGQARGVFTRVELPVMLGVMAAMAGLNLIKNNRRGLLAALALMTFGMVLLGSATLLWTRGRIGGLTWMTLTGLGSYLTYVPFNSVLFERLVAATGAAGTAVFGIYVADAVGYTGSVGLLVFRDRFGQGVSWLSFFTGLNYGLSAVGTLLLVMATLYFLRTLRHTSGADVPASAPGEPAIEMPEAPAAPAQAASG
ncbi:MAG: hypothetical protein AMXMBFR83_14600 [Phycisphaerae bacterium]